MTKAFPKPKLPQLERPAIPPGMEEPERLLWEELTGAYSFNDAGSWHLLRTGLEAHARARRCKAQIDQDGEMFRDRFGEPKANVLIASEREARGQWLQTLKMLRLDLPGG